MSVSSMISIFRDRTSAAAQRIDWVPPLLIRIVLGVTFTLSGWGKLHNLENVTRFFESLGIPAAHLQAPFVASVELVGGILIVAGLATRVSAALLAVVMLVAMYTAIWPQAEGITGLLGTIEAIYLVTFAHLAVHGAGAISLDHLITKKLDGESK